jgi:hypothetical protein
MCRGCQCTCTEAQCTVHMHDAQWHSVQVSSKIEETEADRGGLGVEWHSSAGINGHGDVDAGSLCLWVWRMKMKMEMKQTKPEP